MGWLGPAKAHWGLPLMTSSSPAEDAFPLLLLLRAAASTFEVSLGSRSGDSRGGMHQLFFFLQDSKLASRCSSSSFPGLESELGLGTAHFQRLLTPFLSSPAASSPHSARRLNSSIHWISCARLLSPRCKASAPLVWSFHARPSPALMHAVITATQPRSPRSAQVFTEITA